MGMMMNTWTKQLCRNEDYHHQHTTTAAIKKNRPPIEDFFLSVQQAPGLKVRRPANFLLKLNEHRFFFSEWMGSRKREKESKPNPRRHTKQAEKERE